VIHSKAFQVLKTISAREDFDRFFGKGRSRVRNELAQYFQKGISSKNSGAMAESAQALLQKNSGYAALLPDRSFLTLAKASLELPKEIETYNLVQQVIDQFNNTTNVRISESNTELRIDWDLFSTLDRSPRVGLNTDQGPITLELFRDEAPGSVVNFVRLVKSGFFDGLNFHRVVPNFVIQGGCPRGDGYGGLDYSIRSEFTTRQFDQEGYLGMASAGPHTECTQFFITHSPTLHLNGKYTLFGRVVDGMEVVHKIEPGNKILKAILY